MVEYRKGQSADLDNICEITKKAIALMNSQNIPQWDEIYPAKEDFEQDIQDETLYMVIKDALPAAFYVISTQCDDAYKNGDWEGNDEEACIIHRLCVSPDFQNMGLGNIILNHIEKQLKDMGYKAVRLDVFTLNPYALKLYEKNGYLKRGHADWRKGRFFLMEKALK